MRDARDAMPPAERDRASDFWPTGRCLTCGGHFRLRSDGRMRRHHAWVVTLSRAPGWDRMETCPGSERPPAAASVRSSRDDGSG